MKITVVGAGMVGTEICGYLFTMGTAREIVLIDINRKKAEGEILDFGHVEAFTHTKNIKLIAGDYADSYKSDIVIITAGAQIKQGQSREDLAKINTKIVSEIAVELHRYSPEAIMIVVTNPVDACTYAAITATGSDPKKLLSSGTVLDTARFMKITGDHTGVDPKNVFGYMLGEHGPTGFIPWSICNICGMEIDQFCNSNGLPPFDRDEIVKKVKQSGFDIFERKGNTNHGIAASVYRIIRAIELNEHSVLPVGFMVEDHYGLHDIVLSLPAVINNEGIERILSYNLRDDEVDQLHVSAEHVKTVINNSKG